MLLFCVVAVFLAGLMIGRTPEYVGKKIGAAEIKMLVHLPVRFMTDRNRKGDLAYVGSVRGTGKRCGLITAEKVATRELGGHCAAET